MRFTLTVDCDGSAFEPWPGEEVARMLRVAADNLTLGRLAAGDTGTARDTNGNTRLHWAYGAEVSA